MALSCWFWGAVREPGPLQPEDIVFCVFCVCVWGYVGLLGGVVVICGLWGGRGQVVVVCAACLPRKRGDGGI